ncbi:hypothetical protein BsWGS_26870 [Bradybaena similaris]
MSWHRYALVVIGLTASLCIQKGNSNGESTEQTPAPTPAPGAVCETAECLSAANEIKKKMNLSVNPCEDFNEFACGRFIKESNISEGRSAVDTITHLEDNNQATLRDIIAGEVKATDPQYLLNIKRFYNSCIDENTIEAVGLTPYLNDSEFVDDWPTLNPRWSGANFNLNEVIARYSKVFIHPIFDMFHMNDMSDSSKLAIYLYEAHLPLDQETYNQPRNDTILQAYEKYLVEIAVVLDANREVAMRDAKEVVDLEIELSKIMVPRDQQRNATKLYNPVQLNQLSIMYPELDIVGYARAVYGLVNITLTGDEKVINLYPTFIGNISLVVQKFSNRTLQNLFGFSYAISRVGVLTQWMRAITHEFNRVYLGHESETPRWKFCVDSTAELFSKGISKQFVTRLFSERAKRDVNDMIDNMKEVFRDMIHGASWMSEATKTEARVKLAAMKRKIGYPDFEFEEADIEKDYREHIMKVDDYFGNSVLGKKLNLLQTIAEYGKPVDKNKWYMPPYQINAYIDFFENEIVFLAGIMQQPFYSETFPAYLNYGAIGQIIGHEITHGFDDLGRQYDENGTLRDWWTEEDSEHFKIKADCIIDQNSNTRVVEVNMTLNGRLTQGETIGDRGGLEVAFRAYGKHVRKSGQQPRLPGLDLSQDQLFFLSYAQMHCAKMTPETLTQSVNTNSHPPGKYRIIGTLQNSGCFVHTYDCHSGTSMNLHSKCSVW